MQRYLLSIWRARRASANDSTGPRRELSILYTRFYGALLMVIFFAYQLQQWMRGIIFLLFRSVDLPSLGVFHGVSLMSDLTPPMLPPPSPAPSLHASC